MNRLTSLVVAFTFGSAFSLAVTAAPPKTIAAPKDAVGQVLFNGQNLAGWAGLPDHWEVSEGAITGYTTKWNPIKNNTFLVWTNGTVGDFELHAKYRIRGGNSGIQYRSELKDPALFIVGGYQADIDASPRYSGILYEERGRGILADRGQQTIVKEKDGKTDIKVTTTLATPEALQEFIRPEEWNDYVIVARGDQVMHFINGRLMSTCVDLDASKAPTRGILALQVHAGPPMQVQFKDIVLYPLDAKPAAPKS
ncbi:MAG TPA: DUF1080 domain-containing protein [Verrucomicrobiota bacterium]|nr:DUF1080 domain-containing protein [Verrucomicrobiales bacterium]HRI11930.1 DUF1080 domain-containing protein [Verrucomicrobiota bacterium]